jgi:hypothetical protein
MQRPVLKRPSPYPYRGKEINVRRISGDDRLYAASSLAEKENGTQISQIYPDKRVKISVYQCLFLS